jgi:hypothetical protein
MRLRIMAAFVFVIATGLGAVAIAGESPQAPEPSIAQQGGKATHTHPATDVRGAARAGWRRVDGPLKREVRRFLHVRNHTVGPTQRQKAKRIWKRQKEKWANHRLALREPFLAAYNSLSAGDKAWAHSTGSCEAGNNPATNTGNGFYGLGQFMAGTWRSAVAGFPPALRAQAHSLPHTMSAEAQWWAMVHWRNRTSVGQWPVCGR